YRVVWLDADVDGRADGRPVIQPERVGILQVNAAVAHRLAVILVPVGAVERVALIEILHPLYAGKIVAGAGHALGVVAEINLVIAQHGRRSGKTSRYEGGEHHYAVLEGVHTLFAQIDDDLLAFGDGSLRIEQSQHGGIGGRDFRPAAAPRNDQ